MDAGRSTATLTRYAGDVRQRLRALGARLSRVERWALASTALAAGALFGFVKLAGEVLEGDTRSFDEWLLLALRTPTDLSDPIGPRWFEELMRDFTALGGTGVLTLITLVVVGFLVITRKRHAAVAVALAVIVGTALSHALKWGFDRPRPDLVPHGTDVYTQSFPSGHAMLSAVVYLTLGAMLARVQPERRVKVYLFAVGLMLTLIVGASRVYLGVHWPTDVLAGWSLGAAWALGCQMAMLWLQRRGGVEPASPRAAGSPGP
ncbi:MAG: phosphatase PAP2 family protein [Lautropia sp.]